MKITQLLTAAVAASAVALFMGSPAGAVTLNVMNGSEVGTLDPALSSIDVQNRVIGDYIEGLVTEDTKADAIPGQAESWDISADGLVWTFHLRDGIQWSDGVPVTAADFEYGFRRLFDPATASEYAYLMYPIKGGSEIADGTLPVDSADFGVKAIDDKTLEITLEGPTPFFLQALTHTTGFPVPKHVVEAKGADWTNMENIVSNGPFTPVEWVPGNYVKAVKSETYYDKDTVKLDEVYYYVQDDLSAAFNRYRAGEYDILTDLPNDQQGWVTANLPGEGRFSPFAGVHYYVINSLVEPLGDVNIRNAMSMAINREIIGSDIWGTGEPVAYSVVPPGTANYEGVTPYRPEWADWPYEQRVAEAKKMMEAAGFTQANPLVLTIRYNTNENHQRLAVAIAAMWNEIGIKADLFNAETPVHYDALEAGDFQVGRAGWLMDYSDASNILDLMRTGTKNGDTINWGNNYSRYSNPKFDELTTQAASESDLLKRAALLGEAEALAMKEVGVIPLVYYLASNVVKPNIKGFEDNPKDIHRNRWITKE